MTTALDLNDPFSPCDVKKIRAIEFGILDPEFIVSLWGNT